MDTTSYSASPQPYKLYTERSVWIASFMGSPLAAGVLLRKNYINLGYRQRGDAVLWISILCTVLLFGSLFIIPEPFLDKFPNHVIPVAYTVAIYLAAKKYQGNAIEAHKSGGGEFYSAWNAAGVGAVCLSGIMLVIFVYAFTAAADFDTDSYDQKMAEFSVNEGKAMIVYSSIENGDFSQVDKLIEQESIPGWRNNLEIIKELDAIENLPEELQQQNHLLRSYCQLRIEVLELLGKAVKEDTDRYDALIEAKHTEIDSVLSKLQ